MYRTVVASDERQNYDDIITMLRNGDCFVVAPAPVPHLYIQQSFQQTHTLYLVPYKFAMSPSVPSVVTAVSCHGL
jgi:hypothetical protein